jgi:hypothetical protein
MGDEEKLRTIDDLRPHQREMLDFLIARKRCAWWAEPGTGKTAPLLYAVHRFLKKNQQAKVLLCSFKGVVHSVYEREARKWTELADLKFYRLWEAEGQAACLRNAPGVYLANWERLPWLADNAGQMRAFGFVAYDESSALKSQDARRTKLALGIAKVAQVVVTMDGTPRPTGSIDLYSQLKITDPTWVENRAAFIREFCVQGEDGRVVDRPAAQPALLQRLSTIALVFRAEDVIGLAPEQQVTRHVWVPDHVHEQVQELSEQLATFAGENDGAGVVAVQAAIAVVVKIQQLFGGRAYGRPSQNGARPVVRVHDEKLDALARLVSELNGKPLLVAAQFSCESDAIVQRISGAEIATASNFLELLSRWKAGEIPVLVANPQSLGHGVDGLQDGGARHVCFFSPTWQSAKRQQFIARLRRGGQQHQVTVFDLIAEGRDVERDDGTLRYQRSMDEIMLDRVTGQIVDQASMLKALIAEAAARHPEAAKPKHSPNLNPQCKEARRGHFTTYL